MSDERARKISGNLKIFFSDPMMNVERNQRTAEKRPFEKCLLQRVEERGMRWLRLQHFTGVFNLSNPGRLQQADRLAISRLDAAQNVIMIAIQRKYLLGAR